MTNVHLVGVVNLSPDSITAQFPSPPEAIAQAHRMFEQGATWVDIGAQATNPWTTLVPVETEWDRFEPVLGELIEQYPGRISVDSFRPEIHEKTAALKAGPHIWNDITNLNNPEARQVAIRLYQKGLVNKFIISHLEERYGQDFQSAHHAEGNLDNVKVVRRELYTRHSQLLLGKVKAADIVVDPGIGFSKTNRLNWELVRFGQILDPGMAYMVGFSHKRLLTTRIDSNDPLSKDVVYNESQKTSEERHHYVAEMAIKAAGDRDLYLRVHDFEWYADLIS